jgi:ATP-dependent Clp protease ATP-binding subunit ClpA
VEGILSNVEETGHFVTIAEEARTQLQAICLADLSNGGRGIRNQLEAHFINPLARALVEEDAPSGRFRIDALESGTTTTLKLVST